MFAEERAETAAKLERQTTKLIWLTWAIVGLTAALLICTVFLCEDTHQAKRSESQTDPHGAKQQ
jgi:hypothetical protein